MPRCLAASCDSGGVRAARLTDQEHHQQERRVVRARRHDPRTAAAAILLPWLAAQRHQGGEASAHPALALIEARTLPRRHGSGSESALSNFFPAATARSCRRGGCRLRATCRQGCQTSAETAPPGRTAALLLHRVDRRREPGGRSASLRFPQPPDLRIRYRSGSRAGLPPWLLSTGSRGRSAAAHGRLDGTAFRRGYPREL